MAIWARAGLKLAVVLLALLSVVYVGFFFLVRSHPFRAWAQAEISARSGLSVQLGDLNLSFPFRIVASAVEVSKASEFSLSAERLTATLKLFDLGSGAVHRVLLEKPVFHLDIETLSRSRTKQSAPVAVRYLNVRDGTIVLTRGESKVLELPQIDLQAENINIGAQAGIGLSADVPPLNGTAALTLKGEAQDLAAELVIRRRSTARPPRAAGDQAAMPELVRLQAKFRAPENHNAEATIDGTFADLPAGTGNFTGTVSARIEMDPAFTDASFSGRATLAGFPGTLTTAAQKLPRGKADMSFTGNFSAAEKKLTLMSARLDSALGSGTAAGTVFFVPQAKITSSKLTWRGAPLDALKTLLPEPLSHWSYQGQAQLEAEAYGPWNAPQVSGILRSDKAQLRGENIKAAAVNVLLPFDWTASSTRIKEAQLQADRLEYRGANRWQFAAEHARTTVFTELKSGAPLAFETRFDAKGAKFNSPDNSKLGENLRLIGSLQVTSPAAKNLLTIKGHLSADGGELLWGSFFNDLQKPKPALDIDADYFTVEDRLDCRRCNLKIENVGDVETSGSIEQLREIPELRLQARSAKFSPGAFFEYFVRENLNRRFPALDRLTAAGLLAFQTQLRGNFENLAITGNLSLRAGELRNKSNDWAIGPVALDLPFQVSWPGNKTPGSERPVIGNLAIERMHFGRQIVAPIRATVSLFQNELRFHDVVRAGVFGGEIIVRDLFWPNVIADPKHLSFSLDTKRLQLEELTDASGWPRFSGSLTGSIPQVRATAGALKTTGEIQAELFGGQVRMSKLEIENPFSSLAAIRLDATLANIQLEQLSKTFAFGQISGILEGTIADLVITDGQPAQFGADLHTVDRGGEQRISVEALNKITVLSSGQSAGALYGGLAGLFDSFRYSKLGFKAILRNDRLTLRGVETRGNEEYLVVGTFLPPTVNIVSHTQTIGFSELMRRLERIKADKPEAN